MKKVDLFSTWMQNWMYNWMYLVHCALVFYAGLM